MASPSAASSTPAPLAIAATIWPVRPNQLRIGIAKCIEFAATLHLVGGPPSVLNPGAKSRLDDQSAAHRLGEHAREACKGLP
jgi:hypothetical protein